ncbi:MAG: hypothetical protein IJH94_04510 [Clostridia bacterium]|nr:hypothetical protein [Clostridia bacterium]
MSIKQDKRNAAFFSVLAIVIIAFFALLNVYGDKSVSFDLNRDGSAQIEGLSAYTPHLSLPRGKYEFQVNGNGFSVYTADGRLLGASGSAQAAEIVLDKDESDMAVCSRSESALTRVTVTTDWALSSDVFFLSLFIILILLCIAYVRFKDKDNNSVKYMIMACAVVIASYPAMSGNVLFGHDLNFHLYRIEGIKDGILSGQFPVRVHPTHNSGYGYITASVYPELFLYFPALLRLLGMSPSMAYNCFLVFVNVMTAYVMYVSAKGITKSEFAGTAASVVYTLSTWRAINLFYRAAIGEALAMVFFPLVIYGAYCLIKGDKSKWWILALACTGVFQSHIISTVFVAITLIIAVIVFRKNFTSDRRWLGFIKAGVLTILLNAWYLAAFLKYYIGLDMAIKHVQKNTEFYQNAIFPTQLFNVFNTSFGYSRLLNEGIKSEIALSLGVGITVCMAVCFAYFVFRKKQTVEHEQFHFMLFVFACALVFMATTLFPWQILQQNDIINKFCGTVRMPWRFLSLASPMFAISAAAVVTAYTQKPGTKKIIMTILCFVSAWAFVIWGAAYTNNNDSVLKKHQAVSTAYSAGYDDEYFVVGTNTNDLVPNRYQTSGGIRVTEFTKRGTSIDLSLEGASSDSSWVEVPLLYYPGYLAKNDRGERLNTYFGTNNVLRIQLTDGTTAVKLRYKGFLAFKLANLITMLTIAAWVVIAYGRKKGKTWQFLQLI